MAVQIAAEATPTEPFNFKRMKRRLLAKGRRIARPKSDANECLQCTTAVSGGIFSSNGVRQIKNSLLHLHAAHRVLQFIEVLRIKIVQPSQQFSGQFI